MDFFHCLSLHEAQTLIANTLGSAISVQESEAVPLEQALGRIAAADVKSEEDIPAFARSTVDGYAVNSADTFGAGEGIPATLEIAGEVLMGSKADCALGY